MTSVGRTNPAYHGRLRISLEVGMKEVMLGLLAVGGFVGWAVGRQSERTRRAYKDAGSAKNTLAEKEKLASAEGARAARLALVIVGVLAIIFVAMTRD